MLLFQINDMYDFKDSFKWSQKVFLGVFRHLPVASVSLPSYTLNIFLVPRICFLVSFDIQLTYKTKTFAMDLIGRKYYFQFLFTFSQGKSKAIEKRSKMARILGFHHCVLGLIPNPVCSYFCFKIEELLSVNNDSSQSKYVDQWSILVTPNKRRNVNTIHFYNHVEGKKF